MTEKKKIGALGEEMASEALKGRGYYILARNYTCPYGEIDIIAVKNRQLAFVEVKTRTSFSYGSAAESVDYRKQKHIRNAARYFLAYSKKNYEKIDFQVITISLNQIMGLEF